MSAVGGNFVDSAIAQGGSRFLVKNGDVELHKQY